jgi:transcriptional regulator with XRE-family HTH domain
MKTIGERLKEVRAQLGDTQKEFSIKLNLQPTKIKDIETGRHKLSNEIACLINDIFDINLTWLLTGKGSMLLNEDKVTATINNGGVVMNGNIHNGNGDIYINKKDFENGSEIEELVELLKYAPPTLINNMTKKLKIFKESCEF